MSDGRPLTAPKRTPTQRLRDRAIISRLAGEGLNDTQITEFLNNRPNVPYTISRRMVTSDRNDLEKQWQDVGAERVDAYMTEALARIDATEEEAWNSWFASMEPDERIQVKEELLRDADGHPIGNDMVETERIVSRYQNAGNPSFLKIILQCNKDRTQLLGLQRIKVDIHNETTVHVKTYRGWSASAWDDPNVRVIDGEIVGAKQLEGGGNGS